MSPPRTTYAEPPLRQFYVHFNGASWFVKEGEFFKEQGGLTEKWGNAWRPIWATSIEHARDKAKLERLEGKR